MIVRRCLTLTLPICLVLSVEFGAIQAERWSRQVTNSEWIPLANPRATQTQIEQSNSAGGLLTNSNAQLSQVPQLALPPALQQQYQQQLLQLQKTQENIQKLLLLQQQLRAQQQVLQSQGFLPSGFSNADEDKRLHESVLGNSQAIGDIASEDLVPPLPATEALPPVFPAQNFLPQRPRPHQPTKHEPSVPQEYAGPPGRDFKGTQLLQQEQNVQDVEQIQENQRQGAKHLKESSQGSLGQQVEAGQDGEEEVQLVYVPAETLAQRGQPKRGRGRKQYPNRQQQQSQHHQHHDAVDSSPATGEQEAFARQLLQQIQMEREEKTQFLKEERMKEIARLNEEQRALERKARLQQEAVQREQELQRQREAEKKKKELEKLEELAKQRELERIREAREKQRLEELERRRLVEIRAKEEKRRAEEAARQREAERLALERQKELEIQEELKQQRILEKQREEEVRASSAVSEHQNAQALPLIRDQQEFHRQHLGETPKPMKSKIRGRQRQRHQYQDQQNYRETTTTPSPNQPPLSVYMGGSSSKITGVKVSDVLKLLKDAKTIAVVDTVGPDTPQVFVGPTNLDPPVGYAKFDLPYLSSIDHNRVERKVDKLPFFVAPLSFDPPPGYSKIPFPAPHIGSVVVNTLDNTDPKDGDDQNPSPTPLIEPNSYSDGLSTGSEATTPLFEPQTTVGYSQEPSSTPKYDQTYSTTPSSGYSGGRFRFRQFYGDKPASVVSTSYYEDQRPSTRRHKYYDENLRTTEVPLQSPKVETSVSHAEEVSYSTTPSFKEEPVGPQDPTTRGQDLAAQLALINHELNQHREAQRYNNAGQYGQGSSQSASGLGNGFEGEVSGGDVNDVRAPVGPTQYSLPAELPAISPHLPGLVNSLLDKNEAKLQTTTSTTTTTTTTTTQRTPTTTYRPRSRQRTRVSSTRPRTTTQAPSTKVNADRNRRPYNRSKSRFSTTTEDYRESAYEPTKSRTPETTLKYSSEHRRPASRTQKLRNRDKTSQQSEVLGQTQNTQSHQAYDPQVDSGSPPTGAAFLQPTAPETSHRQLDSSSTLNDYSPENYPSTTITTTQNYPSLAVNHGSPLVSDDYSRNQNYPQNLPDQSLYRGGYDQATLEQTGLEKTPVNGFNYQAQSGEPLEQGILQRPKDYHIDGKAENSDFDLATTPDPRLRTQDEERYSSIYDVNMQTQPEYSLTGQDNLHHLESEKIQSSVVSGDLNEQTIFVPLSENKQEDYQLPVSSTEVPLADITTEATTTSTTPVVIRQRLRGRVGTRLHHEPSVQTRNRGSQDEYVRFNVVNQDSTRTSPSRQRTRSRSRTQNHGSQVQTDGNEYIKLHVAQQQRQVATTASIPSTTTTTTTEQPVEEDVDYGFIRPPNFRPVHPVDTRFQPPVTYRPQFAQVSQQSLLPIDETTVEPSPPPTALPKNRPKYQPTPIRRLPGKPTTLPPPTTTTIETTGTTERIPATTVPPDDAIHAARPKPRPDETKQTRARGRVRRPGKKRVTTTSTTETALEAHNELPLDENYPRIRPQQTTTEHQQTLHGDNYDEAGQLPPARDPPGQQIHDTSSENYPSEFVLNFGNYPEQPAQRVEYDQTQLASAATRKYSQPDLATDDSHSTTADIYGAESQWSTKLTRTSFQPSFAVNQVAAGATKDHGWSRESPKDASAPEIITAAPEVSSVTLVVASDYKRAKHEREEEEEDESMLMGTTMFGRKTGSLDHTEKMNETTAVTDATTVLTGDGNGSEAGTSRVAEPWLMDRVESSTGQQSAIDLERIQKKNGDAAAGRKGGRRRRVRVKVRPVVDDFVTAESQHFNSALNGLFHDPYKYNPIRESKLPTEDPKSSEKSVLRDFLTEILKTDEPIPRTTTTESAEAAWTMSPVMTTPMMIPDDAEETTTIENQTTPPPTTDKPEETTTTRSSEDSASKPAQDSSNKMEKNGQSSSGERTKDEKKTKAQDLWESTKQDSWEQKSAEDSLEHGFFTSKYTTKENDLEAKEEGEGRTRLKVVDDDEVEGFGQVSGKTSGETGVSSESLESSEESKEEDNYAHPKNHRSRWSEVRYPSAFDRSQASWNHEAKAAKAAIPGLETKNEGDGSVKTLSDYVKAIFDSMKSAEEETTIARSEAADETPTTLQTPLDGGLEVFGSEEEERPTTKGADVRVTTQATLLTEDSKAMNEVESKEVTQATESTVDIDPQDPTTLGRVSTSESPTSSSPEHLATEPPTTMTTPSTTATSNTTESILGKVLRTSTTTRVSHMTEICYRGRCVMTRPSQDDRSR
ncbi:uncharacterized protein LOC143374640 isoform X2 [Andrena cerasifolii]|uniref:uncharacterized protein LOC143374640 isoform X2 n=1 Tax=Andrena cerasifolii TaxID=2819439 RepID=UPI0040384E8E